VLLLFTSFKMWVCEYLNCLYVVNAEILNKNFKNIKNRLFLLNPLVFYDNNIFSNAKSRIKKLYLQNWVLGGWLKGRFF